MLSAINILKNHILKYLMHDKGELSLAFMISIFSFNDNAGGIASNCFVSTGALSVILHRRHFVSRFVTSLIYRTKDI